jgi:hypothetical protein
VGECGYVDNSIDWSEGTLPLWPYGKIEREAEALRFGAFWKPVAKIDPASRSCGSREDRTLSRANGCPDAQDGSGNRVTLPEESIA